MIKVNNRKLLYAKGIGGIQLIDEDNDNAGQLIPYRVYVGSKLVYPQKEVIDLPYRLVVSMDMANYRLVDEYTAFGGEPLFPTGKQYKIYKNTTKITWTIETAYPTYVEKVESFEPWEFMLEDGHFPRYDVSEALAISVPVIAQYKRNHYDLNSEEVLFKRLGNSSTSMRLFREEGTYFITIERIDVENGESTKQRQVSYKTPSLNRAYPISGITNSSDFTDCFKTYESSWISVTLTENNKYRSFTSQDKDHYMRFRCDEGSFKIYKYDGNLTIGLNNNIHGDTNRELVAELNTVGKCFTINLLDHNCLVEGVGVLSRKELYRYCEAYSSNVKSDESSTYTDPRIDARIKSGDRVSTDCYYYAAGDFSDATLYPYTYGWSAGLNASLNDISHPKISSLYEQYHANNTDYCFISPSNLFACLPVNGGLESVLATSIDSNQFYVDEEGSHYVMPINGAFRDFFYSIYKGTISTLSGNPIVGSSGGSEWEASYTILENTNPSYGSYAEWEEDVTQLRTRPRK